MIDEILKHAKTFTHNPLGIMALFVTACYGIAGFVFSSEFSNLKGYCERLPVIWFVILFPVIILAVFVWLVVNYNHKLYAPSDFKDDNLFAFVNGRSYNPGEEPKKIKKEERIDLNRQKKITEGNIMVSGMNLREWETLALKKLSDYLSLNIKSEVRIGDRRNGYVFDGIAEKGEEQYFIELKHIKSINLLGRVLPYLSRQADFIQRLDSPYSIFIIVFILERSITDADKKKAESLINGSISCQHKCIFYSYEEIKQNDNDKTTV